jgi:L-ascorbate metabolism protein UlaG (beta-lactamase superfamily)
VPTGSAVYRGGENVLANLLAIEDMQAELRPIDDKLWHHCEATAIRGRTVTLKAKYTDFQIMRDIIPDHGTLMRVSLDLLAPLCPVKKAVRLLGISLSSLRSENADAPPADDTCVVTTNSVVTDLFQMRYKKQNLGGSRARRWFGHLWHEWIGERRRSIAPAFARPNPAEWSDNQITAAWLGHATVLINFFGIKLLTDPVLFPRIGIRLPGLTIGPKRLTAPALTVRELPEIDIVLLSHAHFDHFDMRTLHRFDRSITVITAPRTSDLLRWKRFHDVSELRWKEIKSVSTSAGKIGITAFRVKHWGARTQRDTYRGYNGYVLERNNRRIIFSGDTAQSDSFAALRTSGPIDLAIMPIGAYNPWIHSHCTPEQAVQMANEAGVHFIMPVHHQTFRFSAEGFREPIERFQAALHKTPERIALREIGETFVLP